MQKCSYLTVQLVTENNNNRPSGRWPCWVAEAWVHGTRFYLKESSCLVWLAGSVSGVRTVGHELTYLLLIGGVRFQRDSQTLREFSHLGRMILVQRKWLRRLQISFDIYLSYRTMSVPFPIKVLHLMFVPSLSNLACRNRDHFSLVFQSFISELNFLHTNLEVGGVHYFPDGSTRPQEGPK